MKSNQNQPLDPHLTARQSRGLYVLFMTELWERFSYYGMRALFILYMTNALLFSDQKSYLTYGTYGTLVYITPLLGGLLADRLFGYRRSIIFGGTLMALGQFSLMIPTLHFFYLGLGLLIVGNGLLKPNVSSLLGRLYERNDPRRNSGFTLFYVGVNIGGFLAPILCGIVGQVYGWHYGFGLAGFGMLIGLATFIWGGRYLEGHGHAPSPEVLTKRPLAFLPLNVNTLLILGVILMVPLVIALFLIHLTGSLLAIIGAVVYLGIIYMAYKSTPQERKHLFALLIFMACAMAFWSFQEQAGSSLNLFAERNIDRHLFGLTIPASLFQSVNPVVIFLLGPLFANLWPLLKRKGIEPATPTKFGLGILQLSLGFAIVAYGAQMAQVHGTASMLWLLFGYFFMTTGELCVEPIGISMVTKLSPIKFVGFMMGAWYLSDGAFSNYIAAKIASFTSVTTSVDPNLMSAVLYHKVFNQIAIAAAIIAVVVLILSPLIKRLTDE